MHPSASGGRTIWSQTATLLRFYRQEVKATTMSARALYTCPVHGRLASEERDYSVELYSDTASRRFGSW
jgi:hypothetical protein